MEDELPWLATLGRDADAKTRLKADTKVLALSRLRKQHRCVRRNKCSGIGGREDVFARR